MPYKIDNPPEVIKGLPKDAQAIWIEIYNNAFKQYEGNDKQEELANQTAWAGLKKAGWEKNEDDKWIKKNTFAELHDIEVFAVGTWNNTKITEKDIDDIVNGTNEIIDKVKPFVKLGHDDKQKLLQNSGLPAGGWITKLKRKGQKILVDIADVPQKLYELISKGAYKRISSEILWDYTEPSTKRKYNKVLSAIAFLGADLPAVTNLEDIAALYSDANKDAQIILYEDEQNKKKVNDKNIKKGSEWIMPNGIKVQELEGKKFVALEDYEAIELEKAEADKMKKDYEEAQAKLKKYEEEQKRLKEEARKKDIEKFVADNCSETTMHFLPKQKDIVMTLMESFDNENKWEFTEGSNTKELTQAELFKMFIELQPNMAVDKFKELSSGGDNNNEPETDLDKINKYAEEHKMTFADAAIALFPNGDYKLDNK
ncbi:ChaB family protein [Candidatus Woesearchaeota archaeon]|nr:ChaB family protein [Candidatus Woesearchaeota archaeon]